MEYTGRCVAVSEPASPTIIATKYAKFGDSSELRQLARDVIRWECRPYTTMQPPPLGYFLKLIPPDTVVLPMFRQHHLLLSLQNWSQEVYITFDLHYTLRTNYLE